MRRRAHVAKWTSRAWWPPSAWPEATLAHERAWPAAGASTAEPMAATFITGQSERKPFVSKCEFCYSCLSTGNTNEPHLHEGWETPSKERGAGGCVFAHELGRQCRA